jgi:hypothetical protein
MPYPIATVAWLTLDDPNEYLTMNVVAGVRMRTPDTPLDAEEEDDVDMDQDVSGRSTRGRRP